MKRILLAVCGLSPQVITETLYALHQQGRMPDAVRIITTREGRAAINAQLLDPETGHYYQFLRDYGIDPSTVDFASRHVLAVSDTAGRELDDIGDEEDNEQFLRVCMSAAFELTADPDSAVYFSIAGGRKTMGACLTAAAQCYARPQDRIFHVLVSPEFEGCREFFYPPSRSVTITLRDRNGNPYLKETRYAAVSLVPMPFFSIRDRLHDRLLKGPEEPASLMVSLVREKRHELTIDLVGGKVVWKGRECDLMPAKLAIYAFFALRKKNENCDCNSCRGCETCFLSVTDVLNATEEIAVLYRATGLGREIDEMSGTGVRCLNTENFNSYKAKIRKDLEKCFGAAELKHLEIASRGRRPGVRYGIRLERERIRVVL